MKRAMRRLAPRLLIPLLGCSPAWAEMTMRVFAPAGGSASLIRLKEPTRLASAGKDLKMTVFPGEAGSTTRQVQLQGIAAPAVAAAPPQAGQDAAELRLTLSLAARRDALRWGIADYDNQPDTLSELSWRDQQSLMLTTRGEAQWPTGWWLAGELGVGTVLKGEIQDSDYDGNNRTLEWSRTVGDSKGGSLLDLLIEGGHRLRFGAHSLTASLGYAFHEQHMHAGNLTQVVSAANSFGVALPAVGTMFDAQSTYTARWWGPRLGLGLELALPANWGLKLGAWREWVNYKGSGNWALREEFQHPKSFTHLADGRVSGFEIGLVRPWLKSGRISLTWGQVKGRAGPGEDITHFVDFGDTVTRLNEVVWDSESLRLGLQWSF